MVNKNAMHHEEKNNFQFTLGPVQGFVAQARRTRDFWAGSFILSWLSAIAIQSIKMHGGEVTFPIPDDNYMNWLVGEGKQDRPQQGSIPNRFKALTAEVDQSFDPDIVARAVREAWHHLAEVIWENDFEDILSTEQKNETKKIWDRQVSSFWEISWVIGNKEHVSSNLLDRRKNWRTSISSSEPGHKCMMMDGWQELSGITVVNLTKVDKFWEQIRLQNKNGIANDIREGERLCAMAYIKRRFAHYFEKVDFNLPYSGEVKNIIIKGWKLPKAVPSVSFLAAVPWLTEAINHLPVSYFVNFHDKASLLLDNLHNEIAHTQQSHEGFKLDIKQVSNAIKQRQSEGFRRELAGLDGTVYFKTQLENIRNFSAPNSSTELRVRKRMSDTLSELTKITTEMNERGLQKNPSPYYAILLMDGDQLGKQMSDINKQKPISNALNQFTQQVPKTVYDYNGFLIYAGGDDVLAIFPMEHALSAAVALQREYLKVFEQNKIENSDEKVVSTLSGAIEFVHIRTPLTQILRDAHSLLDDVAKADVGRNAIAVRVWKPTGLMLQWAMPWEKALDTENQMSENAVLQIEKLVEKFRQINQGKPDFSNKFFFRAKQLVERLSGNLDEKQLRELLISEWYHSYDNYNIDLDRELFDLLIAQSWVWYRQDPGKPAIKRKNKQFNPDTALLVRFLAQKGLGRENDA